MKRPIDEELDSSNYETVVVEDENGSVYNGETVSSVEKVKSNTSIYIFVAALLALVIFLVLYFK